MTSTWRNSKSGLVAFTLLLACSAPCVAETISIIPTNPTSRDSITLVIDGTLTSPFDHAALFKVSVNGTQLRVDVCIITGFQVPGNVAYQIPAPIGTLAPATYVAESYHAFCALSNGALVQLTAPTLSTATTFAVASAAPEVIPTMSVVGLVSLVMLLSLVFGAHQRYLRR